MRHHKLLLFLVELQELCHKEWHKIPTQFTKPAIVNDSRQAKWHTGLLIDIKKELMDRGWMERFVTQFFYVSDFYRMNSVLHSNVFVKIEMKNERF